MRRALLAAVAFALLAPAVAGQGADGVVQSSTGVLMTDVGGQVPPGEARNLTITVTYRTGLGAISAGPTVVTLTVPEVPPWANFTFEPDTFTFDTDPAVTDEQRAEAQAVLSISPDAPAFGRGNLTLVAQADQNGNIRPSEGQYQIFVIPGFDATMRIDAPPEMRMRGGTEAVLPFLVTNLGNAEADVTILLPSKPESARVEVPPAARLAPGESAEREIRIRASWVEGGDGILTIAAEPAPVGRSNVEVEPTTFDVLVTTVAAVPGPGLAAVAAIVGLAALGARQRAR